jgi:hypothetical protein
MKTKLHMKIVVFFLLGVILFTFTHCLSNAPTEGGTSRKPSSFSNFTPPTAPKSPEEVINMAQVEVGVKTFEEIYQSFSAITGISEGNTSVLGVYRNVVDSLPTTSEVKSFLPSNQVAIAKLASEFCTQLVDTNNGNRMGIWPGAEYNQILGNFNNSRRMIVIQNMLDAFWGMGVVSDADRATAEDELFYLMDLLDDNEPNTATSTRKVIKGACTVALSSAFVVMY